VRNAAHEVLLEVLVQVDDLPRVVDAPQDRCVADHPGEQGRVVDPQPVPGQGEVPEDVDGLTVGFEAGFTGARCGRGTLVAYGVQFRLRTPPRA